MHSYAKIHIHYMSKMLTFRHQCGISELTLFFNCKITGLYFELNAILSVRQP